MPFSSDLSDKSDIDVMTTSPFTHELIVFYRTVQQIWRVGLRMRCSLLKP